MGREAETRGFRLGHHREVEACIHHVDAAAVIDSYRREDIPIDDFSVDCSGVSGGDCEIGILCEQREERLDILKIGRCRVIVPQGKRWDDLFQHGPRASADFVAEGEQPPAEAREPL